MPRKETRTRANPAKTQPDLTKELGVLARQLGNTIKAAAKSDEVKNIGSEIGKSIRTISRSVADAAKKVVKSKATRSIRGQAKKVIVLGKDKGLRATKKWPSVLSKELHKAGKELKILAWRLKKM